MISRPFIFLFSDGYDWPCCKNCTYTTTKGQSCRVADETACRAETLCDGKNAACPDAPPMSDGTPCIDRLVLSVDLSAMLTRQLEASRHFVIVTVSLVLKPHP